ncbi:MAG: AEC family transporter [Clostridia bacterium]|nr:AEC family transporter [Clostridia bacterium]
MFIDNLIVSINAVVPMFMIILAGFVLKRMGVIDPSIVKNVNKILFDFIAPCLLFSNLYGKEMSEVFRGKFTLYIFLMQVGLFLLVYFIFGYYKGDEPKVCGAMIQGVCRSNIIIMGIPLAANLLGAENIALTTLSIAFFSPVQTVCNVIALERYRGGKVSVKSMLKSVFTNPFIIGTIAGLVFSLFHLRLPQVILQPVNSLGNVFSPMALLLLGASLDIKKMKSKMKETMICTFVKLVIYPAVALTCGALLGFRGDEIVTILVLFASSTAVMTFTMAQQMNSDSDLAGSIVVFSSVLSCFTILICILITKTLGLF